ncbi:MAG TPA: VWA domain-containing protein [Anaerolineales bacterium]|nr:VWA domain-containing protein [Anaerolineales bacterium]
MDLLWPGFLFLLLLIPVLIALYIWMLRRRHAAVRYSSLSLVRAAVPPRSRLRRHIPPALFLLGLASLVVALGRPVAIVTLPTDQTTIILTMDVSGSMRSMDIPPSRLQAAEAAALNFIQRQKSNTQIGVVAFSGYAEEIQPPTTDQEALQAAVESLTTGRRTAIGSGILQAIDAISEVDKNVVPSITDTNPGVEPTPLPKGDYVPDIIVLLTDGVSNAGPAPLDAAQQAVDRGIRVYTIGFGTDNGSIPADTFGGGFAGGGGGGFGGRFRTGIDETVLKQIASMTGGTYNSASSAGELQSVFENLPTYLIVKHGTVEITVAFAALGAFLFALAIGLSMAWHPLP